jgi:beta-fructofuranosidase
MRIPFALRSLRCIATCALALPLGAIHADLPAILDKTLVAWVSPNNLDQRGGSVLTLEKGGGTFDGIVFGELTPGKWMAGSDGFRRTKRDQADFPGEAAANGPAVQIAITYKGREISIYRNGILAATYTAEAQEKFGVDGKVLIGLRHVDAGTENRFFTGSIEDARIYDRALGAEELAKLKPNQPSEPAPVAWWDFEGGRVNDRMNNFPATTLFGGARVEGGRLVLDHPGAFLLATHDTAPPASGSIRLNETVRAHRENLLRDPHRAGYHFVIPEGQAMPFDPNGAIYWKGRYHLFYIFQDSRGHNWGHVSSTDLFHWRHHPTGLVAGMFSGNCFLNKEGRPTMCYHQVGQGNAMAVAVDDELNEWKKLDSNPITPKTTPGDGFDGKYRSWDPFGWVENGSYYAIFGGEHPAIAKAPTLGGEWKYVGDLMGNAVDGVSINEDVSCADFFQLGDRRMLLCISHRLGARYYLGEWKNEQFHPSFHEKMSWADNEFFAPESLLDDRGRRIMWAWLFDEPGFKMHTDFGWSGTMSLPRVLSLAGDGRLRMAPPAEIESLRYDAARPPSLALAAGETKILEGAGGDSLEVDLTVNGKGATRFGAKVCMAPDGSEETVVYYDATEHKLKIDTTKSSTGPGHKGVEGGPLDLPAGEPLRLRIFVDKSVVEVFANDRQAVMRRIYPSGAASKGVAVFADGGAAEFTEITAWRMSPSNPY